MSTATRKLQIDVEVNLQQSKQALQQVVAQTAQAAQQITQINKTQATSQAASAAKQEAAERRRLAEIRRTAAAENALWRQRDRALKEERQYWAQGARADRARANEAERAEKRRLAELKRASAAENALWRQRDRALKEEQRQKDQAARADRARANEAERAEKRRLAEIRRTAAAEKALYDQRTREIKRAEKAEQQESRRAMFQAGGGLAAGYGVARVGREALDFAKEGAQALALDKSFKALGYTLKDLDGVLAATGYNLDKVTVQRMVNLGHSFGFSVKQVTQFADIARAASIKTGQDMKWMFDSIVTGTARQSRLILDNLGILLDLSEAYKSHAATLGKTADALTDYEKKQAVVNEVMRQGKKFIEQVPLDKLGESIGRTETAFKDLWSTVKGAFAQWFVWTTSAYTGTAGVSENLTRLEHKTRKYGEAVLWLSSLQTDQDKALAGFGGEQLEALMQQKAFEEQFLRDSQMGVHALPTNPEQIRTMMDSLDIHKNIRDQVEKVLDGTIATEAERRKVAKLLYEEGQRINKIAKESLDKEAQLASYRKEQLTALREQERLQQAVRDAHAEYVGQQDQEARNIISANAALREHLKARILLARLPLFAAGAAGLPGGALRPAVKLPGADPSLFVGPPNKPDNRGGGAAPQKSKPRSVSTDNAVGQVAVQWGQNLWITPEEQALLDSISDSPVTESGNTGQDQSPTKKDKGKKVKEPKHIDPVGYLMGLVARREQQRVEDVDFFWQVKHGRKANPEESLAFQSLIAGAAGSAVGLPGALFKQQMQGLSPNVFAAGTDEELAKARSLLQALPGCHALRLET
jgi:hypothetical protein